MLVGWHRKLCSGTMPGLLYYKCKRDELLLRTTCSSQSAVVIGSGVKVGIAGPHIRWKFDALKKLYFLHIWC